MPANQWLEDEEAGDSESLDLGPARQVGSTEPTPEPWGGSSPPLRRWWRQRLLGEGSLAYPGAPSSVSRGPCSLSFRMERTGLPGPPSPTGAILPACLHPHPSNTGSSLGWDPGVPTGLLPLSQPQQTPHSAVSAAQMPTLIQFSTLIVVLTQTSCPFAGLLLLLPSCSAPPPGRHSAPCKPGHATPAVTPSTAPQDPQDQAHPPWYLISPA